MCTEDGDRMKMIDVGEVGAGDGIDGDLVVVGWGGKRLRYSVVS